MFILLQPLHFQRTNTGRAMNEERSKKRSRRVSSLYRRVGIASFSWHESGFSP